MTEVEREIEAIGILALIANGYWKFCYGRCADSLEKNTENENEYMIWENAPILSKYASIPAEMGSFTPATFTAGLIEVVLECCGFVGAKVTAHNYPMIPQFPTRTVYLIKLTG